MRRLGVALALVTAVAGLSAAPSFAYRGYPTAPVNDSANNTTIKTIMRDTVNPAPDAGGTVGEVSKGMSRVRVAAGLRPLLKFAGELGLAATAFDVGWRIGSVPGSYIYERISGNLGTTSSFALSWTYAASVSMGGSTVATNTWVLTKAGTPTNVTWYDNPGVCSACGNGSAANLAANAAAAAAGATLVQHPTDYATTTAHAWVISESAMEGKVTRAPSTSSEYTGMGTRIAAPYAGFTLPGTTSDAQMNAGLDAVGARDGTNRSTSDPDAEHTVDAINHQIVPGYSADVFVMPSCVGATVAVCSSLLASAGWAGSLVDTDLGREGAVVTQPAGAIITQAFAAGTTHPKTSTVTVERNPSPLPLLLPQPLANETADEYQTRLEELGLVGPVTIVQLTPETASSRVGTSAPVRVQTPYATPYQWGWPSSLPRVWPDDPVTIYANPDTMPPVDESSGPPGSPPGVDFTPITGLDFGCKFPFGLFCYAKQVTDWFRVSPVAPSFDFTFSHIGSAAIPGGGHYNVDLADVEGLSGYMAILRAVFSVVLWVGAVWMLASRLLGLNLGDPGEAIDDA
jgi:hypothetical protein